MLVENVFCVYKIELIYIALNFVFNLSNSQDIFNVNHCIELCISVESLIMIKLCDIKYIINM